MSEANTVIPLREHQEPAAREPRRFKVFTARQLDKIEQLQRLDDDARFAMRVVANVLPFRVNEYVIEELIDWDQVPNDPIYQLTFPQKGMLAPEHFDKVADAMRGGDKAEIDATVAEVREALNPHPAGQMEHNIPEVDGEKIDWLVEVGSVLHGGLGWVLLAMIVGHIGMALVHRKQSGQINVLPRMWGKD